MNTSTLTSDSLASADIFSTKAPSLGHNYLSPLDMAAGNFNHYVSVYLYISEALTHEDGSINVILKDAGDNNGSSRSKNNNNANNSKNNNGSGSHTGNHHALPTASQSVVNTRAAAINIWRDVEDAFNGVVRISKLLHVKVVFDLSTLAKYFPDLSHPKEVHLIKSRLTDNVFRLPNRPIRRRPGLPTCSLIRGASRTAEDKG